MNEGGGESVRNSRIILEQFFDQHSFRLSETLVQAALPVLECLAYRLMLISESLNPNIWTKCFGIRACTLQCTHCYPTDRLDRNREFRPKAHPVTIEHFPSFIRRRAIGKRWSNARRVVHLILHLILRQSVDLAVLDYSSSINASIEAIYWSISTIRF